MSHICVSGLPLAPKQSKAKHCSIAKQSKAAKQHATMDLNLPPGGGDDDETLSPLCQSFASDGFVKLPGVLTSDAVEALNRRLEHVLRGQYDRGVKPDKTPKLIKLGMATQYDDEKKDEEEDAAPKQQRNRKRPGGNIGPLGFTGSRQNAKVLQVINVHKCDQLFRELATNAHLGRIVAKLAGWKHGARLAQDQVWAKPPGSPPLTYHRDSPYFMFTPSSVVTVWVAFDDIVWWRNWVRWCMSRDLTNGERVEWVRRVPSSSVMAALAC